MFTKPVRIDEEPAEPARATTLVTPQFCRCNLNPSGLARGSRAKRWSRTRLPTAVSWPPMRPDMAKVIVGPAHGSRMPTKGRATAAAAAHRLEDQPKREGIKVRGGGQKSLNEHLSPLRRYLAAKVGQRWDKIFADVCRYLDRNSAVQDHVRDHLEDYVAIHVVELDGQLFESGRRYPIYSLFYVCPRTGILRKNRDPRPWRRFARPDKLRIRFVDDLTGLIREDGVWYIIESQVTALPKTAK